ncbi:class I SAM-dependent methyltransferase [Phytoactinopolyspora mesophila]|uniref:Methyltransferase domain-containing protein n=1 Tax=Phytoactinopolyspora mesophila TaxID=2650750 RepID=A0A7K3MAE5_9ACTN|nr:methyltransferase domain-containing protein [Phytoactinopolyspora mesophila]NDL60264.1 methyltransferase domain-containing protein [Phytoactinopolyspora mesophila]
MSEPDTKTVVADAFHAASAEYEQVGPEFFALFGRTLVEKAMVEPGMRVLDVGCGTGAALLPAAEAVGNTGRVLGIDLAAGMVERVEQAIAERGWTHAEAKQGDAEDPPADPAGWDRILAAQVLFFLPDPAQAVTQYHRRLKPGGVLAFSSWGPDNPDWAPVHRALFSHIPEGSMPKLTPSGGTFKSDDTISELLESAGFASIEHETITYDIVYDDPEQWLRWSRSHGAIAFWDAIPADELETARNEATAVLESMRTADGTLHMVIPVRYTVAMRPSPTLPH